MPNDHVTTIRLPIELADVLELVARVEGKAVSVVIREAIAAHIERRRADPDFMRRLRERIEADKAILERLADGPADGSGCTSEPSDIASSSTEPPDPTT